MLKFWAKRPSIADRQITRPAPAVLYAIGDIHGCLTQLTDLQSAIIADGQTISGDKLIITIGDHIDRGPASAGVLDLLLRPLPAGFSRIALMGNHEAMMLEALDTGKVEDWLSVGGVETLTAYGIGAEHLLAMNRKTRQQVLQSLVPPEHVELLRSMPLSVTIGDHLFVHAGVRPDVALDRQTEQDLLWIREPFLSASHGLPYTVVHGHTPGPEVVQTGHRIGLDTHAYAGGKLSAARIMPGEELKVFSA